ncbi:hypothetical protein F0562_034794 [Nyssa sinensis]|uniref:Uncharacterized protein n=1 Tax=Nyssa sinensis TaxID=561372 RepID=A0A5J5AE58_9ASTE|nr:hypothetical protein F0562_034794 [Nyssa sinensis]
MGKLCCSESDDGGLESQRNSGVGSPCSCAHGHLQSIPKAAKGGSPFSSISGINPVDLRNIEEGRVVFDACCEALLFFPTVRDHTVTVQPTASTIRMEFN